MNAWTAVDEMENVNALADFCSKDSRAIQSQYSASAKLKAILAGCQDCLDPQADINAFYAKWVDIYTAEGEGLDNWGRIVGIGREIERRGQHIVLDDEDYRSLLLYKALSNISQANAATINRLLKALVDTGVGHFPQRGYVLEINPMVIRWVFEDYLTPAQEAIFDVAGHLTRGAGVGWEFYAIDPAITFGFDGSKMQPFNQAPFVPDGAVITYLTSSWGD